MGFDLPARLHNHTSRHSNEATFNDYSISAKVADHSDTIADGCSTNNGGLERIYKTMDYEKMTDKELVWAYYNEPCPYNKMDIARHVKNEKMRKEMLDHANYLRHKDEAMEY